MRSWRVVAALAGVAVVGQCYGLYRVTGPPIPPWFPNLDKVEHALGFAVPVWLTLLAVGLRRLGAGHAPLPRAAMVAVAVIFLAQAVLSELAQHLFYRFRSGDPLDVAADTLGIGLGTLGARLMLPVPAAEPVPR